MLAGQVLLLIALGLFLAIGLEPAVSWLIGHRFPRWAAVLAVLRWRCSLLLAGFVAAAIPALVDQGGRLIQDVPQYLAQLSDSSTAIGQLNEQFQSRHAAADPRRRGAGLAAGVIGAGEAVFGRSRPILVVAVLTVYFLADLPRVRATCTGSCRTPGGRGRS